MTPENNSLFELLSQVAPVFTLGAAFWVMFGFARPNAFQRFLMRCLVFSLLWFSVQGVWTQLRFLLTGEGISWAWFFICVCSFIFGLWFVLKKS